MVNARVNIFGSNVLKKLSEGWLISGFLGDRSFSSPSFQTKSMPSYVIFDLSTGSQPWTGYILQKTTPVFYLRKLGLLIIDSMTLLLAAKFKARA